MGEKIQVTSDWLESLTRRLYSLTPDGFRVECRVLRDEVVRLRGVIDQLEGACRDPNDPESVAYQLGFVGQYVAGSMVTFPLTQIAAAVIRRLMAENARLADIAADATRPHVQEG